MTIGVDARPIQTNFRAGISNYIYHVLDNLPNEDIQLFYKTYQNSDFFNDRKNFTRTVLQFPSYKWKFEQIWENFFLPRIVNTSKTDLFWGGRFFVPSGLSCPSVATIHDLAFLKIPGVVNQKQINYFNSLIKRSLKTARSFIAISETTKSDFCELYHVSEKRVQVVYNGYNSLFNDNLDEDEIKRTQEKFSIQTPFILFLGTMEPRKNLNRLLKAFIRSNTYKVATLVISGKMGWMQEDFIKEINPLIKSGKVILTGYVTDTELLALYKGCLFFAFPSLYEGFGIPVLEAMASGAPVLTSNNSSLKELFTNSTEQVDAYDIDAIAHGIDRFLDKDFRHRLINAGKETSQLFSWKKCADEHLHVFKQYI